MSTCKFFLQGTCKYGDNCRFSHQINDTSQTHGTSIMTQNLKPPTIDTNLLVKSVVTDMVNAENGGHWLLSSYTPFKDKPSFPGFENQSFEEVRYGYYEAMKNGTFEQYKQQLHIALQEAAMKMKALQNPTSEIISMLIQIYNTPTISDQNNAAFVTPQYNSILQQNQAQSGSIFAIANQQLFGKASNQQQPTFGEIPSTNSIFNSAPQQNTNQNLFNNNQSIFNNQQTFTNTSNKSIFGNQNFAVNSNYQNSPLAAQNPSFTTQNNIFAQPNNTFNANVFQTSSNSPFINKGQPINNTLLSQNQPFNNVNAVPANVSPSTFGGQMQQSVYSSNAGQNIQPGLPSMEQIQGASPLNSAPNTIFNVPTSNTNMFTQQTAIFNNQSAGTEQKLTNSIFAQNIPQPGNIFSANTETIDSSAYSKLEDLSESDIKSFGSECFEFGKIPEKPPTSQMCN